MKKKPKSNSIAAGLARHLSKSGYCSRSKGIELVLAGSVTVNGKVIKDPGYNVRSADKIAVEGADIASAELFYAALNKPAGLVTTENDEQGRKTVFSCFEGSGLPRLIAVGRLDLASEGLLLFTNDTAWAHAISNPVSNLRKVYHVQLSGLPDEAFMKNCRTGIEMPEGGLLKVDGVKLLRSGDKNHWVEIVLSEGRNRHIRRMAEVSGKEVMRLIRVKIGKLELGAMKKGEYRMIKKDEV